MYNLGCTPLKGNKISYDDDEEPNFAVSLEDGRNIEDEHENKLTTLSVDRLSIALSNLDMDEDDNAKSKTTPKYVIADKQTGFYKNTETGDFFLRGRKTENSKRPKYLIYRHFSFTHVHWYYLQLCINIYFHINVKESRGSGICIKNLVQEACGLCISHFARCTRRRHGTWKDHSNSSLFVWTI